MKSLWQTELLRYAISQHPDSSQWSQQQPHLMEVAAQSSGSEDHKLQWLIDHLPVTAALQRGVQRYLQTVDIVRRLLYLLAFMVGLGSSFSLLGSLQSQVNLLHVSAVCALTPLFALLLWFISWLLNSRPSASGNAYPGIVGRSFAGVIRLISRLLPHNEEDSGTQTAILRGWQRLIADKKLSFWSLSTLTHAAWLTFSLGALLGAFIRLSLFQYDFYWGSTILPEDWLTGFLQLFFALPGLFTEMVTGSSLMHSFQINTADQAERQLWGWLVLVSISIYGVIPRLVLSLLARQCRQRALQQLPSAFSQPFYRQLIQQMHQLEAPHPVSHSTHYPDAQVQTAGSVSHAASAVIAFELDREPSHDHKALDLGHIRNSRDYQQALNQLAAVGTPVNVTALCSLARSPDATLVNRLVALQQQSQSGIQVRLTEATIAHDRGIDITAREDDWRDRLQAAGISQIIADSELS